MINTKNKNFRIGAVITVFMLFVILLGFVWTPYDPNAMNAGEKMLSPCLRHVFGTDNFGRDLFSRVINGAGSTFLIAAAAVTIGLAAGILIGGLTAWFGGWVDELLMRINDSITAFPSILLALVLIAIFGNGRQNVILALGFLFIPSFARLVRTEVARQKTLDYVRSARLMGVPELRILFVHVMPNTIPVLLSAVAIAFNNAVLAEASMSYLGIGVQPPDASLGRMLNEAQAYLISAPWYALSAGLAMVLLVLGFGLLSDGLGGEERA